MGLEVQDKIHLTFGDLDDQVKTSLKQFEEYICIETQANSLDIVDDLQGGDDLEIDHYKLKLKIKA